MRSEDFSEAGLIWLRRSFLTHLLHQIADAENPHHALRAVGEHGHTLRENALTGSAVVNRYDKDDEYGQSYQEPPHLWTMHILPHPCPEVRLRCGVELLGSVELVFDGAKDFID